MARRHTRATTKAEPQTHWQSEYMPSSPATAPGSALVQAGRT